MKTSRHWLRFLVLAMLAMPASISWGATAAPAPAVAPLAPAVPAHSPPSPTDYAAREVASAPAVEKFQGGGAGIYIGGSTLAIVLIVVLIIIIL
jgi:hypothetical protein